jgi:PAS domain S-box-containing protein
MALGDWEQILGVVVSSGGIVWAGYKHGIKPMIKKQREQKQQLVANIIEIRNELRFNGGSSIKDVVCNVSKKVDGIITRLDGIEQNHRVTMTIQGLAFWESDSEGKCTYASQGLCKIMGRSESEIKDNNWSSWLHPEDRERVMNAWQAAVEHQAAFDEIYRFKRSDGKWVKVWGFAFPMAGNGKLGKLVQLEEPY